MDMPWKATIKMFAMKAHQRMSKTFYDYSEIVIIIPYMYGRCKCNTHMNEKKSMRLSSDVAYTWSDIYSTCDGLPEKRAFYQIFSLFISVEKHFISLQDNFNFD